MCNKLFWIKEGFIDKELYAPFVIEHDSDYYNDLCKKYNLIKKRAREAGADSESINIIEEFSKRIRDAVKNYYKGNISKAHNQVKKLVKKCIDNKLAVSELNKSYAFPGTHNTEVQLFRSRLSENVKTFRAVEMLHLPFDKRGLTGNYRFSLPGVPSLYLGNTSYACWVEMGCPPEHTFNVSPVILDGSQKIFNLAVMMRDFEGLNDFEEERVHCWIRLIMLMIATSYRINEEGRTFKSEYIISQSIMLACKSLDIDGVAYYSKRVDDEIFAIAAVNVALFAEFRFYKKYARICEKLKIDDSFNYSMYKQLGFVDTQTSCRLKIDGCSKINNIGTYKRQYGYRFSEFYKFDKFIYSSWTDKDEQDWGEVIKQ